MGLHGGKNRQVGRLPAFSCAPWTLRLVNLAKRTEDRDRR